MGTEVASCTPAPDCLMPQVQVVADFIVRFVAHLQTRLGFLAREGGLLPTGVGLITSHPTSDAIRGVRKWCSFPIRRRRSRTAGSAASSWAA
jgi:hypothetical protein